MFIINKKFAEILQPTSMKYFICSFLLLCNVFSYGQDVTTLVQQVRDKLNQVSDYQAEGKLKTDVAFLKIPISKVQVFYKKPNRFRIKKDGGISLLPKGGISVNLNGLVTNEDFAVVDAGSSVFEGISVKIVKLLPLSEKADVVITTLYIDEKQLLILKSITTTRDNGTYDMQMKYGKFAKLGLPDQVVFTFNTKDYKLPKGVTFEYETGEKPTAKDDKLLNKKGRVEIYYKDYIINKGLSDSIFQ
jgi:outer membrane lipoprotein-sorting protein